jgi:hypothetical protein
MLKVGWSRVRDPMRSLNLITLLNLSGLTKTKGFTRPLTEMSTRSRQIMFLASKERPVLRVDKVTSICGPTV